MVRLVFFVWLNNKLYFINALFANFNAADQRSYLSKFFFIGSINVQVAFNDFYLVNI